MRKLLAVGAVPGQLLRLASRSGLETREHVHGVDAEGRDGVAALENEERGKIEPGDAPPDLEVIVRRQKKVRDGVFLISVESERNHESVGGEGCDPLRTVFEGIEPTRSFRSPGERVVEI